MGETDGKGKVGAPEPPHVMFAPGFAAQCCLRAVSDSCFPGRRGYGAIAPRFDV
jgi:hypothetical protein